MDPFSVEGVAVVTGAAHGIGRASAVALGRAGATVAAVDLEEEPLESLIAELATHGATGHGRVADCTDAAALRGALDSITDEVGPITTLFNNVGRSARERSGPFLESEEDTWRDVIDVCLLTAMRACRIVAPSMVARGFGRIINMSTEAAFYGDVGLADYAAAKMGVVGFTRSLARELAPSGVLVNAVAPGAITTRAHEQLPTSVIERIVGQVPLGHVGVPDDVANTVVFLASPAAGYMTGQTLLIDGGRWML